MIDHRRKPDEVGVIRNFRDNWVEDVFDGIASKRARQHLALELHPAVSLKLQLINIAGSIADLKVPPSNRLEALIGKRADEYSIRINNQWRIVFRYEKASNTFYDVGIEDYH